MKLDEVRLKNFRAYRDEISVPMSALTAFIGKNDIGKSSVLEALEIFFNSDQVVCERDDLSVCPQGTDIEITCTFSNLPSEIVLDSTAKTSLEAEYLLNADGKLEIKKVYACTAAKPKEKIFILCTHPSVANVKDLLSLKRTDLRQRATTLGVDPATYNASVNPQIRKAIWAHIGDLDLKHTELLVENEDAKKIYEELKKYLPIYALFQSDRQSKDDDKEVTDPMKVAIQQALRAVETELDGIKETVKRYAINTAERTLLKLKEMAPDLADSLVPEFRSEPKFDSQFKLTLKSDDDIPINKRGSGVRRLMLLNFFRAEAERQMTETSHDSIIYAFEEPETSQHPNHQRLLIESFLTLSNSENCQVILTTHTPALAGLLPLNSLRYIDIADSHRIFRYGTEDVFQDVCDSLGVLPDPFPVGASAILLVEGKGDITFLNHTAEKLKEGGFLTHTFIDKNFAIVPTGGCDNLKHWYTMKIIQQFALPWCVLLDSDKGTPEEQKNQRAIETLRRRGIKAYATRKREPENYIHYCCLGGSPITYSETDDAKKKINGATRVAADKVLEHFWPHMTVEQIREVEEYTDNGVVKYEFTDMIQDFLALV